MAVEGAGGRAEAKKAELAEKYCEHAFGGTCRTELDHLEEAVAAEKDAKPGERLQTSRFMAGKSCEFMVDKLDKKSECTRDVEEFIGILRRDQIEGE